MAVRPTTVNCAAPWTVKALLMALGRHHVRSACGLRAKACGRRRWHGSYCVAAKASRQDQSIEAEETSGILIFGVVMLAFIATRIPGPVAETADRDPGILTLVFSLARAVRVGAEAAFARRCALAEAAGGPNPL